MLKPVLVVVLISMFVISSFPTIVFVSSSDGESNNGWNDSCYNAGYDDGQNGPFSKGTYDHCGEEAGGNDAYYDSFIDGCMSVEDNTRDVCESATDA